MKLKRHAVDQVKKEGSDTLSKDCVVRGRDRQKNRMEMKKSKPPLWLERSNRGRSSALTVTTWVDPRSTALSCTMSKEKKHSTTALTHGWECQN